MNYNLKIWPLLSVICLALASCRGEPRAVIFEMPDSFLGAFVIRVDANSNIEWQRSDDLLVLKVSGRLTSVRNFDTIEGKYLEYKARLSSEILMPLVPMSAAKTHKGLGLFGGNITNSGEMHFYLGDGASAIEYFDTLSGKKH
tara:strand:- start:245 stop:673 length:429 start_codon:yes stop_codon:yes gene_type:complete